MVYFGQDGSPYCKELMQTNFSQKAIADKTRAHFVAIALNIWGDREVTWTDGRKFSEKQLEAFLKVQFTPTLLFFDEKGEVAVRLNGYYQPHRFEAVLDYVAGAHGETLEPRRVSQNCGQGIRKPRAARRALLPPAAVRFAPQGRETPRGAVRDPLLRGLRRAAPGRLQAQGDPRIVRAFRRRAFCPVGARRNRHARGHANGGGGLGARPGDRVHAVARIFRRGRQGSVPHRGLPAPVSPARVARVCRERSLQARAELPAFPAGPRPGNARARGDGRSLALKSILDPAHRQRPVPMQRCSDAPTRARRPPRRPNLEEADRAPDLVL